MPEDSEDAATLAQVADRLFKAFPGLAPDVIRDSVATGYAELRYVRVRTYLPVLVERRAHDLLVAAADGRSGRWDGSRGR
ncbi:MULTISPECIES: three-helix bundle dimerization domain-containing protein [unclassified Streptomyces]|uniref:three-helix bundle dimerization domain-containing protein n=1 Tax=unclassified Streptomyces TaxID=2593676 RepID=UPI00109E5F46|nr:hypothetical protein [Streptomyces sp. A1136]THA57974.1 hypothetical protein E6R62_05730 [Streptomyces sp. A1136]